MALTLSMILSNVTLCMMFAIMALEILKVRAVKRSRARYLARTFEIFLLGLFVPANLVLTCMLIYEAETSLEKGFDALIGILIFALYGKWLVRLLKDGDDDWFNDQQKKLKRWIKDVRTARRLKPAYAT